MSRSCRTCCLVTVEEGYQKEALKMQVEKEEKEDSGEKESGTKSFKKWLRGMKEKASAHEDAMSTAQRTARQKCQAKLDCSQIITNKRRKRRTGKRGPDGSAMRKRSWRRFCNEGGGKSLQAEVTKKVLELEVHERMSQGEKTRGTKEKKNVKRWSTEEMKDKPSSSMEEDTGEMIQVEGKMKKKERKNQQRKN